MSKGQTPKAKLQQLQTQLANATKDNDQLRLRIASLDNALGELAERLWPHLKDAVREVADDAACDAMSDAGM
jgi:chromosome segregation ATPase